MEYIEYHKLSSEARDIDTSNECLKYICDRFELNMEQRYWLAFLYATCYSSTTVYYMYNEFPDFENVDTKRLQRWWEENRDKVIFQTDRKWCRSRNQFVDCFLSYKGMIGNRTQEDFFKGLLKEDPKATYRNVFKATGNIFTFGRFTLFIYMEMIAVLTNYNMIPDSLELEEAESCKNGLAYAIGRKDLMTHKTKGKTSKDDYIMLYGELDKICQQVIEQKIEFNNIWNIETTLCAYKKYMLGKRYVGYYIERFRKEIVKMEGLVKYGVNWKPLWDFRKTNYDKKWLKEL